MGLIYQLGKREAKRDARNIGLKAILPKKALPSPPFEYDVDFNNQDIWPLPMPVFANDKWGCCVIAGRANFTLRMERLEQGVPLPITDEDVLREYWKEQGDPNGTEKPDNGLYVLDSIKRWRSEGWMAAGNLYNIYAFAEIDHHNPYEVIQAIYLLNGLMVGASLPQSCIDQLDRKEIWTVLPDDGGCVGGHLMYVMAYTRTGPVFLTWGQRQVATWEWFMKYVDEAYGVVDDRNKFMDESTLDVERLDSILKEITA